MDEEIITPEEQARRSARNSRLLKACVLSTAAVMGFGYGFSKAQDQVKRRDKFHMSADMTPDMNEIGTRLAVRALKWGTIYAVLGVGSTIGAIWLLSGARDFQEFRQIVGSKLPRIPKNDPPQSRTEFEGLTDLITYLSTWGKEKETKK